MTGDVTWTATYHVVYSPRARDRDLGEGSKAVNLDAQLGAWLNVGCFDGRRGVVVEDRDIGNAHLRGETRGRGARTTVLPRSIEDLKRPSHKRLSPQILGTQEQTVPRDLVRPRRR